MSLCCRGGNLAQSWAPLSPACLDGWLAGGVGMVWGCCAAQQPAKSEGSSAVKAFALGNGLGSKAMFYSIYHSLHDSFAFA